MPEKAESQRRESVISPPLYAEPRIIWEKHQTFPKASALFHGKIWEKFGKLHHKRAACSAIMHRLSQDSCGIVPAERQQRRKACSCGRSYPRGKSPV